MWRPGEVVALRDVWFGSVWRAVAAIVVDDRPERSVFWIPAGSASAYPVEDGREVRIPRRGVELALRRTKHPMLVVCEPDQPWTLWLFFRAGRFEHWYVNFEEYLGRSTVAWDSVDHKLDLIVRPDGSLRWKDEDELELAGSLGLVDVAAVRRDAARAVAEPPWPTGWERYRPDPAWAPVELPLGWGGAGERVTAEA